MEKSDKLIGIGVNGVVNKNVVLNSLMGMLDELRSIHVVGVNEKGETVAWSSDPQDLPTAAVTLQAVAQDFVSGRMG
jgi:hypothetical protein